jgi:hypothetical protein
MRLAQLAADFVVQAMPTPSPGTLKIVCEYFTAEESNALRRLLALLRPYLKQAWTVVDAGPGDLYFQNLDVRSLPVDHGAARVVGCAQKPRLCRRGTIHRPFRVSELLAVLAEAGGSRIALHPAEDGSPAEWTYQLRTWPLEFEEWPKDWWRVLACIAYQPLSMSQIAAVTALPVDSVHRCLDRLIRRELVDRRAEPHVVAEPSPVPGWRGLVTRLGQLLGFGS